MPVRAYRLGRRQASVDRTAASIAHAAAELVAGGKSRPSAAEIARVAGVSRATVYNRFGSVGGLLDRLAPTSALESAPAADVRAELDAHLRRTCEAWAVNPRLYRNLPRTPEPDAEAIHALVGRLAAADALRAGCSLKEAEDVVSVLSSFSAFDRLHRDGRRQASAVADILIRLASATLG